MLTVPVPKTMLGTYPEIVARAQDRLKQQETVKSHLRYRCRGELLTSVSSRGMLVSNLGQAAHFMAPARARLWRYPR